MIPTADVMDVIAMTDVIQGYYTILYSNRNVGYHLKLPFIQAEIKATKDSGKQGVF